MEQLCVSRLLLHRGVSASAAGLALALLLLSSAAAVAALPAPATTPFQLKISNGRLTVDAENVPLDSIVEKISEQANVPIVLNDGVGGQTRSFHIKDVPWSEALRTMLRDCDSFFLYSSETGKAAQIAAVWVYPAGRGRTLQPIVPQQVVPLSEIERDLKDPNPQIRTNAVEKMIERGGRSALNAAMEAVADPNDQVRSETLYAAWAANLQLPEATLQMLALGDKSPTVRFLALQSLQNSPTAVKIAEHALHDPDSAVQNEARAVLDQLQSQAN